VAKRIVICEASVSYGAELHDFIVRDPALEVGGVFRSAEALLPELDRIAPALITMGLEMPGMGSLAAIREIMRERPCPIVVVSKHAATSERAADALAAGALEVIPKTALRLGQPDDLWAIALRSRIKRLASIPMRGRRTGAALPRRASVAHRRLVRIVGIGASTGGPLALAEVLGALPADFTIPVLVVQHISDGFGPGLVTWLGRQVAVPVAIAIDGAALGPGVWFAPEGFHLGLDRSLRVVLDGETVHGAHRPSVDMLFASLATAVRQAALGVVLTGMGRDGAEGVEAIRASGGHVIAQDEASSAVYGMPRAALEAGADQVLALEAIGPELRDLNTVQLPA
jgi:two-component system chemotaxis response regulator CheB